MGADDDYVYQVNAYLESTGLKEAYLWVYNKNSSERMVLPIHYSADIVDSVRNTFKAVHAATKDKLPDRKFLPQKQKRGGKETGIEYLPWQCTYCPFTERCYGSQGFVKETDDKGKSRYTRDAAAIELDSFLQ